MGTPLPCETRPLGEETTDVLDVHPPHHALQGWRDFLLHILTITIGLLIALGLEGAVDAMHHRHVVREARADIRRELERNLADAKTDIAYVNTMQERMRNNLLSARDLRDHPESKGPHALVFNAAWSGFSNAAWQTARDMGALGYMNTDEVERYADVYSQQGMLGTQGTELFLHQSELAAPMMIAGAGKASRPEEIEEVMHGVAVTLVRLDVLRELLEQLVKQYGQVLQAG